MGTRQSSWPPTRMVPETPEEEGEREASDSLGLATRRAHARAAEILASREIPADLLQLGKNHGIETIIRAVWKDGFQTGMRMAMMPVSGEAAP
jgi:hypothetical protein